MGTVKVGEFIRSAGQAAYEVAAPLVGALSRLHSVFICHAIYVRLFNDLKTMLPSSQMDFNSLEDIEGSPCPMMKFRRLISISHANLLTEKGPSAIAWAVTALGGCQVSPILS